jgi:hypothetical protein
MIFIGLEDSEVRVGQRGIPTLASRAKTSGVYCLTPFMSFNLSDPEVSIF